MHAIYALAIQLAQIIKLLQMNQNLGYSLIGSEVWHNLERTHMYGIMLVIGLLRITPKMVVHMYVNAASATVIVQRS